MRHSLEILIMKKPDCECFYATIRKAHTTRFSWAFVFKIYSMHSSDAIACTSCFIQMILALMCLKKNIIYIGDFHLKPCKKHLKINTKPFVKSLKVRT